MAKIDKSKYSKEQIKELRRQKAERKLRKRSSNILKNSPDTYNVLVLKHGKKYTAEYVNKMYRMVKKHCTLPFNFYCLTEDITGLDNDIKVIPLPGDIEANGWWYKPYIFSADLPIDGVILYIDLDMVIVKNIDILFTYMPNASCVLRDFTRVMRPKWEKYNSSLIRYRKGQFLRLWEEFKKDSNYVMRRHFGDQDFLWERTKGEFSLWPDNWIRSWKWEIRQSKKFKPGAARGNRQLETVENCVAPPDCCIVAFHGDPNMHNCHDPFIVDNWHKI